VRTASAASCFALLKPTKGAFLGSQASLIVMPGWAFISNPAFFFLGLYKVVQGCTT
jgi:hypothetical protein